MPKLLQMVAAMIVLTTIQISAQTVPSSTEAALIAKARAIHDRVIKIDTHNDMPSRILDDGYDPDVRHPAGFGKTEGNTDFPRLVESGMNAEFM